jgi:hypothetical protein
LNAYHSAMDRRHTETPAYWAEELARSDDELARGERVPSSVVRDDILRVLAEFEAEAADKSDALLRAQRGH